MGDLPRRINEAFAISTSGRPGPVLVDLPKDVTASILTRPILGDINPKVPQRPDKITPGGWNLMGVGAGDVELPAQVREAVNRAAEMINNARRPIFYVGAGILSDPSLPQVLKSLAKRGNIPVTTTLQGLGSFDELDPLSLHMLGMHGSAYANLAMQTADVIIAVGARFDDRVTGNLKSSFFIIILICGFLTHHTT